MICGVLHSKRGFQNYTQPSIKNNATLDPELLLASSSATKHSA